MTIKTFATSAGSNDLYLDLFGNLKISSDIEAVSNICECVSRTLAGECVLNTDVGLPNFELIWTGAPNIAAWEDILRTQIRQVTGVLDVLSVTALRNSNGTLQYTMIIQTEFGEIQING